MYELSTQKVSPTSFVICKVSIFVRGYKDFRVVVLQALPELGTNVHWTRVTTGIAEMDIALLLGRERVGQTVAMDYAAPNAESDAGLLEPQKPKRLGPKWLRRETRLRHSTWKNSHSYNVTKRSGIGHGIQSPTFQQIWRRD
jgi:hypothetical protein